MCMYIISTIRMYAFDLDLKNTFYNSGNLITYVKIYKIYVII